MNQYVGFNFLDDGELPDPANDKKLKECPECGAEYNLIYVRRGPTLLMFSKNLYQVVCLNCYYKGRPANSMEDAVANWSNDQQCGLDYYRNRANLTYAQLAELAGLQEDTVRRIGTKKSGGSKQSKKAIALVLGVSPKEL